MPSNKYGLSIMKENKDLNLKDAYDNKQKDLLN